MAAGTPREFADLHGRSIQAGVNLVNRYLGRPQDTRDLSQPGLINLPNVQQAEQWLLNRFGPYLPADTGRKPPVEQRGLVAPTERGILGGLYD